MFQSVSWIKIAVTKYATNRTRLIFAPSPTVNNLSPLYLNVQANKVDGSKEQNK